MAEAPLSDRLLAVFLGELAEQLRAMTGELLALERMPTDAERLRSLFRIVHTLKGAAGAARVPLVAECCHRLETRLAHARGVAADALDRSTFDRLFAAIDALDDAHRRLAAGDTLADSPLERTVRLLSEEGPAAPTPFVRAAAEPWNAPPATAAPLPPAPLPPAPSTFEPGSPSREAQVRVPIERLDALRALARRLVLAERRMQGRVAELAALHAAGALHAGRVMRDAATEARELNTVTAQVAAVADRLLARPLRDTTQPLARVVRDAAASTGKRVRLVTVGDDVEADRRVLDALREALPHLARNAVDHGIEAPVTRRRTGKPEVGTVTVAAAVRGRELTVTVADDGAGIDLAAVRAQLACRGVSMPDDEAVLASVFESGLSTRAEPTTTSGRGVGLDAVRAIVARAGGSVRARSAPGQGTTFTLACPIDLTLVRMLVFVAAQRVLAVPSAVVERVIRLEPARIRRSQDRSMVTVPAMPAPVPILSLGRLFGAGAGGLAATERCAVVIAADGRRVAVAATELVSEEELVVRPVPHVGAAVPYLAGAALLGERIALVLDASALIEAGLTLTDPAAAPERPGDARKRILVVDDSITTRALHQNVLEAAGYEVVAAGDGAAAWRMLEAEGADLVVADVQMPVMDGFALCETIRRSDRFRDLPVVLVTAAESPEHRARGLEAGADAYLGKTRFDEDALRVTIRQLLEGR